MRAIRPAIAVGLILLGAVFVAIRDGGEGDGGAPVETAGSTRDSDDAVRLVPVNLPSGFRIVEVSAPGSNADDGILRVYGAGDPMIGVRSRPGDPRDILEGREVTVNGHVARIVDVPHPPLTWVSWFEGDRIVDVLGRGVDEATLLEAAARVQGTGADVAIDADGLPARFRLLSETDASGLIDLVGRVTGDSIGPTVHLRSAGAGPARTLTVTSDPGDENRLAAWRFVLEEPARRQVRGREATSGSFTIGGVVTRVVAWQEDGAVIELVGLEVDEATMLTMAEGLQPASDRRWQELEARFPDEGVEPGQRVVVSGVHEGVEWRATVRTGSDGGVEVCVYVDRGGEGESSCSESAGTDGRLTATALGDTGIVYGVVERGIARLTIRPAAGGSEVDVPLHDSGLGQRRAFVATLPSGTSGYELAGYDAGGARLEHVSEPILPMPRGTVYDPPGD